MIQECSFNPICDVAAVEQTGYVDLAAANAASSIPSNLDAEQLSYNDIDDPNSIGGRPSDTFDAAQMAMSISSYVHPKKDEE